MVAIQNLHKHFNKNIVLQGIDLQIDQGGIFAVLGPNGSGKTTLIKCILGMVIPNAGDIAVQLWTFVHGTASLVIDGKYDSVTPGLDYNGMIASATPLLLHRPR